MSGLDMSVAEILRLIVQRDSILDRFNAEEAVGLDRARGTWDAINRAHPEWVLPSKPTKGWCFKVAIPGKTKFTHASIAHPGDRQKWSSGEILLFDNNEMAFVDSIGYDDTHCFGNDAEIVSELERLFAIDDSGEEDEYGQNEESSMVAQTISSIESVHPEWIVRDTADAHVYMIWCDNKTGFNCIRVDCSEVNSEANCVGICLYQHTNPVAISALGYSSSSKIDTDDLVAELERIFAFEEPDNVSAEDSDEESDEELYEDLLRLVAKR